MRSKFEGPINFKYYNTPIGDMLGGATKEGICYLGYANGEDKGQEITSVAEFFNASFDPGNNSFLSVLEAQLAQYFSGTRKKFEIPLLFTGTEFQEKVWKELLNIPFGLTLSYLEQTLKIAKAEAIRAVASANGKNKIAILVPCHRVLGAKGKLTGYAGGIWRKKWLLDHEKTKIGEQINFQWSE